jgi:hypothetical protein
MFRELDVVALTEDVVGQNLFRGNVGAIVEVYSPDAFEVEFVDDSGQSYGLATLHAGQLLRLQFTSVITAA